MDASPFLTPLAGLFYSTMIQQVIVICVAFCIFVFAWFIIKRLFRWVGTEDGRFFKRRIRSLKLQDQELLNAEEITKLSSTITSSIRRLINVILFSALTVVILTQFESSSHIPERVWASLFGKYLELQQEFIDFIPSLAFILVVGFVTHFIIRIVRLIFDGLDRGRIKIDGFYQEWARPTFSLARLLIIAFAFVIVFPYMPGSHSPAFKGLSIFIGVLVSLGSTSAITNIIAGVAITYMRAFQTGDRVRIAETTGDIVET